MLTCVASSIVGRWSSRAGIVLKRENKIHNKFQCFEWRIMDLQETEQVGIWRGLKSREMTVFTSFFFSNRLQSRLLLTFSVPIWLGWSVLFGYGWSLWRMYTWPININFSYFGLYLPLFAILAQIVTNWQASKNKRPQEEFSDLKWTLKKRSKI